MDDLILSNINSVLDNLNAITSLSIILVLATIFSWMQNKDTISIANLDIPKSHAGVSLFALMCLIMFQTLKLIHNLWYLLNKAGLSSQGVESANFIVRVHSWIANPFSETISPLSLLTDNMGFSFLLLLWWLGFHAGFLLLRNTSRALYLIGLFLFIAYLALGIISMFIIMLLMEQLNENTIVIKIVILLVMIPIGSIGIRLLISRFILAKNNNDG